MDTKVASIKTFAEDRIRKFEEESIHPLRRMVRELKMDLKGQLDARTKLTESAKLEARVRALEVAAVDNSSGKEVNGAKVEQKTWFGKKTWFAFFKYLSLWTFIFNTFEDTVDFWKLLGYALLAFFGIIRWYKKLKNRLLDWVEESDSLIASILATIISLIRVVKKKLDELENLAKEESETEADATPAAAPPPTTASPSTPPPTTASPSTPQPIQKQ